MMSELSTLYKLLDKIYITKYLLYIGYYITISHWIYSADVNCN